MTIDLSGDRQTITATAQVLMIFARTIDIVELSVRSNGIKCTNSSIFSLLIEIIERAILTAMNSDTSSELQQYVEEYDMFAAAIGMPHMAGKILGWLMVCNPPFQTAGWFCWLKHHPKTSSSCSICSGLADSPSASSARWGKR